MPRRTALLAALAWCLAIAATPPRLTAQEEAPSSSAPETTLVPADRVGIPLGLNKCLSCHAGIETINAAMDRRWRAGQDCAACHRGDPGAADKADAHADLIAHPGDLHVVEQTCGTCHSRFGRLAGLAGPERNDIVDRVLRSPMALAPGEIATVRYLWGEQQSSGTLYGVRSIASLTEATAPGTVPAIAQLPAADASPADHLLRTQCLRCHLWTRPEPGVAPFRGAGCSACHVPYAADGRSRSEDATISKVETGHPVAHRIERYVPDDRCLTCHRDEGLGIGWNFTGWLSTGNRVGAAATPQDAAALPVPADVHAAAGMGCIDCHDSDDVHGDGAIHARGRTAVGITCVTCHGRPDAPPTFTTKRGDRLPHVELRDGEAVLTTKLGGGKLSVPRIDRPAADKTVDPHRVPAHLGAAESGSRLACVACHAGEITQHFLRRFDLDQRQAVQTDWGAGLGPDRQTPVLTGRWNVDAVWSPTGLPMLGVDAHGTVAPLLATLHGLRSIVDAGGAEVETHRLLHTADGRYGVGYRTADPHRTQRAARTCASCHDNPAALGLGSPRIDAARLGWPLRYAADQVADAEGTAIAAFPVAGERPLNFAELSRVLRPSACATCHESDPSGMPRSAERFHPAPGVAAATPARVPTRVSSAAQSASAEPASLPTPGQDGHGPRPKRAPHATPAVEPPSDDEPELSPFVGR